MFDHEVIDAVAAATLVLAGVVVITLSLRQRSGSSRHEGFHARIDPGTGVRATWGTAVVASFGAALIHLAFVPEHLGESWVLGFGFLAAAGFQVAWAVWASVTHDARVAATGIAGNVVLIALWVVSRTIGLPFGDEPWVPEAAGRADIITIALEALIVAAVVLGSSAPLRRLRSGPGLSVASILFIPAIGLIAVATILALAGDSGADPHHAMGSILDATTRRT